jgi:hypothetical protein
MYKGNQVPHVDLSRPVTEEVLDEIQARLDAGWRVRNDMQLLLDYARKALSEARCTANRGVCEGVSSPSDGCSQGNSSLS